MIHILNINQPADKILFVSSAYTDSQARLKNQSVYDILKIQLWRM